MYKHIIMSIFLFCLTATCGYSESTNRSRLFTDKTMRTNISIIAQLTLDLDALSNYYHVDVLPERSPLVVVINDTIKSDMKLTKFEKDVVYMKKSDTIKHNKAYFEFTKIDIGSRSAKVEFLYPVEGIAGMIIFKKSDNKWEVCEWKIVER